MSATVLQPGGSTTPFGAGDDRVVIGRGLGRAFDGRSIYRDLDLDIRCDEFVALLGRSGSGKSTLLRSLAGLDDGYDGSVLVPPTRAVVFQEPRLLPWRSVIDNVLIGLRRDATNRARAEEALVEVGLAHHASAWPVTLSGGEAQRVALARALVREPELLLLDEPFGALDALTRLKMHELLRRLCSHHRPGVLLVTHDVDEAIALADRVLVLDAGGFVRDISVGLGHPRPRTSPEFAAIRGELLAALGVDPAGV